MTVPIKGKEVEAGKWFHHYDHMTSHNITGDSLRAGVVSTLFHKGGYFWAKPHKMPPITANLAVISQSIMCNML